VARLAGRDRYQTAVRVSERDFADGADTVVIASGAGFADALSAAGLAGAYDAPVLLVPKVSLPAEVRAEIVRLGATRCLVVGGPAVVDGSVLAAIDAIPGMQTPKRIWGQDRYATSALVADAVFTKDGIIDFPTVTYANESLALAAIARGDAYPDALALAPIAWAAKMPILLTNPGYLPVPIDDRLPGGAAPLLIQYVVFAGGSKAISDAVYTYVDGILPGNTCQRIWGNDRYETAKKIADWSDGSPWLSYEAVGVATGVNFPDALGGGAGIAKGGGVLLMTEPRRLTPITAAQLAAKRAVTHEVQVFGGTAAVTDPVLAQIRALY
jgi:putative cell wall-binding protein